MDWRVECDCRETVKYNRIIVSRRKTQQPKNSLTNMEETQRSLRTIQHEIAPCIHPAISDMSLSIFRLHS